MESIDTRKNNLEQWLKSASGLPAFTLEAMVGDASFRRYFRVKTSTTSYVAMDAPPPQEQCGPFVAIAKALHGMGLNTPEIIHADTANGFLLLSDFGDHTYLKSLSTTNANQLYATALTALARLQSCRTVTGRELPPFTYDFMWQEWAWHKEWFLGKLLNVPMTNVEFALDQCVALIVESAVSQPQVFMHRDYHSANLMVLPANQVGILDFQDAFIGPVTYDLVSLLRDCYIDWPEADVTRWALWYRDQVDVLRAVDEPSFLRWFDLMGMQRHLKALFTFARKHVRDEQSQYLAHVPRTLNYLLQVSARYPEFAVLHDYLRTIVQPAFAKVMLACAQ